MNTRRRIAESAVKQQLDVVVGSQRLAVECEMEINTTGSLVFQHRLQLPTGFRVKEVHLSKNAQPVLIRTASSTDEELTVFVPEGVMGQQKLTLKGELPHNGKTVPVPEILFETGETLSRRARIYRKPEVLVQVSLKNPANRLANDEKGHFYAGFGRLVADWTESFSDATEERRQQTLKILPNQRRLRCNSVTRVFRKEVAWWTAIDCHVTVLSGVCDEIQVDIPESWTGNFQLTPAMP